MADGCVENIVQYLFFSINFIWKVQHNKPSKEKVFSHWKNCSYDIFDMNMDKLVKDNFIEIIGDNDQESLFF